MWITLGSQSVAPVRPPTTDLWLVVDEGPGSWLHCSILSKKPVFCFHLDAYETFSFVTKTCQVTLKVNAFILKDTSFSAWVSESCSVVSDSLRPHGLYSPCNSPGQNTGVDSHSLLQRIFPTQVSCVAGGFLPAEPQEKPKNTGVGKWVAYPFSSGSSRPRNQTGVSWIAGRFFTSWDIREDHIYSNIYYELPWWLSW